MDSEQGIGIPKNDDVSALIRILEGNGEDLSKFSSLEDYTIFAVQYRYEAYDDSEEPLDRQEVIKIAGALLRHVAAILGAGG